MSVTYAQTAATGRLQGQTQLTPPLASPYTNLKVHSDAYQTAPEPKDPQIVRAYIQALRDLRLAEAALRIGHKHAAALSAEELLVLKTDRAAELTRLAAHPARQINERHDLADRALQLYEQLLNAPVAPVPGQQEQYQRARIDRLLALHARGQMQALIQAYQVLQTEGVVVPAYALGYVASAYLAQRQPEQAAALYRDILSSVQTDALDPDTLFDQQAGLFYAQVETGAVAAAQTTLTDTQSRLAAWHPQKGTPLPQPSDHYLAASHYAALSHFYANDLPSAQHALQHLVDQAPGHSGLRSSLAEIYLARQWPERAEYELKIAETQAPRALAVMTAQADTALALREWRQAEQLIVHLGSHYPENVQVQRLQRRWASHQKPELQLSAASSLASDSPVAGDGSLAVDARMYSAPFHYAMRGFVGAGYAQADFAERHASYRWYQAGLEWRQRSVQAALALGAHHYGYGSKLGVSGFAELALDDHWQVGVAAAFRSPATPLRALAHGIMSNRLEVYGRWRAHEQREWRLNLSTARFSDGNQRLQAQLHGQERLYTTQRLKLDAQVVIEASRNSHRNAPYFNPRSTFEVLPSLTLSHQLYQRYEHSLEQRFTLGAGWVKQQGYAGKAVMVVGVGLTYRMGDDAELGFDILGVSRPYDGRREREIRLALDLRLRF